MTSSRREVLYSIGLGAAVTIIPACGSSTEDDDGGGVAAGVATMCGTDLCFKISENPDLQADGGIAFFAQVPGKKMFVQRVGEGFLALSSICTHAGCSVSFDGESKFNCPCHGSQFNADGTVSRGPAGRPLTSFDATVAGDDVTIALS
jgi:Rieske Fe-S protein